MKLFITYAVLIFITLAISVALLVVTDFSVIVAAATIAIIAFPVWNAAHLALYHLTMWQLERAVAAADAYRFSPVWDRSTAMLLRRRVQILAFRARAFQ